MNIEKEIFTWIVNPSLLIAALPDEGGVDQRHPGGQSAQQLLGLGEGGHHEVRGVELVGGGNLVPDEVSAQRLGGQEQLVLATLLLDSGAHQHGPTRGCCHDVV